MDDYQKQILDFWFTQTSPEQWFQVSTKFDQKILDNFHEIYKKGVAGDFEDWKNSAKGALSYCILLDQMPRNMFRGTPKAFATDALALKMARYAVHSKFDDDLSILEKRFIYLPYEHSEDLKDQETSVQLFEKIKQQDAMGYEYAVKHYDVIKEYGRFPHRNEILRRSNTKAEEEYLSNPNAGF